MRVYTLYIHTIVHHIKKHTQHETQQTRTHALRGDNN
jgi:hypothetical protein